MFTTAAFQRVVKESGLSKYELRDLYGVSRQTIYDWAAGSEPKAGSLLARMADAITVSLLRSIDKKVLPMAPVDKDVRKRRIAAMRQRLEQLVPSPR